MPQEDSAGAVERSILRRRLSGQEPLFLAAAKKYGIDPHLLMAISMAETYGNSRQLRVQNNPGGLFAHGHYTTFGDLPSGIDAMAQFLSRHKGMSISQLAKIYAPPGAANDPNHTNNQWPAMVRQYYSQSSGQPSPTPSSSPMFGEHAAPAESIVHGDQSNQLLQGSQDFSSNVTGDMPASISPEGPEASFPVDNSVAFGNDIGTGNPEPVAEAQPETPTSTWQDYSTPEALPGLGEPFVNVGAGTETSPVQSDNTGVEFNTGSAPMTFGDLQSGSEFIPGGVNFQAPSNSGEETMPQTFDPNTPGFAPDPVDPSAYAGNLGYGTFGDLGTSTVPLVGAADEGVPGAGSNDLSVVGAESGPSWSESSSPVQSSSQVDQTDNSGGFYGLSQTPPDFSPDPVISPGVGGPFSDANLLPGATSGLGQGGGGNLGAWNPMKGMWGGKRPYTEENYNNFLGWGNYQGNATGQTRTKPLSYQQYVTQWNQLRSAGHTGPATSPTWSEHSAPVPLGAIHAGQHIETA